MFASSSTIKALLLATLAVVGGASTIRGNNNNKAQDSEDIATRDLQVDNMGIGLNEMVCQQQLDGSVMCSFRTMPPTDLTTVKTLGDCVSNFCITSDIKRVPFSQVPSVPANPVRPPVVTNPNPVGTVGQCPATQPLTGLACSQFIPRGATAIACVYNQMRCECMLDASNPTVGVGWDCFIPQRPVVPNPVAAPVPAPVPAPSLPPNPFLPPPTSAPIPGFETFSQFTCRPRGNGCSNPWVIPSSCDGLASCCPGSIIADWRTGKNTCRHGTAGTVLVPEPIDGKIDFDPNSNVIAPTIAPVPSSSGQILAVINNPPNCPMAKPEFGDACDWGQRCQYYVYGADGAATGAVNCDCNGDCVFQCRKALNPGFQAF